MGFPPLNSMRRALEVLGLYHGSLKEWSVNLELSLEVSCQNHIFPMFLTTINFQINGSTGRMQKRVWGQTDSFFS